jgi:hypothetical protein
VFDADTAERYAGAGRKGDPDPHRDLAGGHSRHARRAGILTARGGMTSHAAVVAAAWAAPACPARAAPDRPQGAPDEGRRRRGAAKTMSSPSTARPAR